MIRRRELPVTGGGSGGGGGDDATGRVVRHLHLRVVRCVKNNIL